MSDPRQLINLEAYLRSRRPIFNDAGGRGYERGVRVFDCPFCADTKHRGWMNVSYWAAGCFNMGCPASRDGFGAVEWVRRLEARVTRGETWRFLRDGWGLAQPIALRPAVANTGPDFCRFPDGMREFSWTGSPLQDEFTQFALTQWGIGLTEAREYGLGWSVQGEYAWRIIIPIRLNGNPVAFQARSIRGADPKYRTSRYGDVDEPKAECGRPVGDVFFNYDALPVESEALLVEGAGDAMAWHKDAPWRNPHALGMCGQALTPTRIALLRARRVERVIVALDAEPETEVHAAELLEDLRAWDIPCALGAWIGGKDPGAGASLDVAPGDPGDLGALLKSLRRL